MSILFKILNRLVNQYEQLKIKDTKNSLGSCGANVYISSKAFIWSKNKLQIGDSVCIHAFSHIFAGGGLTIGSGTIISNNVSITTVTHSLDPENRLDGIYLPTVIGKNVWIGMGAIILPGITIGDHSIVGAGSIVTKSIPPMSVFAGTPAKFLKDVPHKNLEILKYNNV
jgi:maltose O-acetyltransferase